MAAKIRSKDRKFLFYWRIKNFWCSGVLTNVVAAAFPQIQQLFTPQVIPGYAGWRLDGQQTWDTSVYVEGEEPDIPVDPELYECCLPILEGVDHIVREWLKEISDHDFEYERTEVFITKYTNLEGVKKHADGNFISALVGLNSEFTGGELKLWEQILESNEVVEHDFRYAAGDVILMTGDVDHMGTSVDEGERWIMALFYQK